MSFVSCVTVACSPRDNAQNGLQAPMIDVLDSPHFPDQDWPKNPGPGELPDNRRSPCENQLSSQGESESSVTYHSQPRRHMPFETC